MKKMLIGFLAAATFAFGATGTADAKTHHADKTYDPQIRTMFSVWYCGQWQYPDGELKTYNYVDANHIKEVTLASDGGDGDYVLGCGEYESADGVVSELEIFRGIDGCVHMNVKTDVETVTCDKVAG